MAMAASTATSRSGAKQSLDHGSYHGYRTQRGLSSRLFDPRLQLCEGAWFDGKRVLDVGCNEGDCLVQIALRYKPNKCVGVDISESLVRLAKARLDEKWALGQHLIPSSPTQTTTTNTSPFPLCFPLFFGVPRCPFRITFHICDFSRSPLPETLGGPFDTIICFSVTKWVHLNGGDEGLVQFFKNVRASLIDDGGIFVLEFQRSYVLPAGLEEQRSRRENLKIKPEDIPRVLLEGGGFKKGWEIEYGTEELRKAHRARPVYCFET